MELRWDGWFPTYVHVCGYLTETRQLPIQPIGQHKVTSDAVGFEDDENIVD
jgi:hypothetical protein